MMNYQAVYKNYLDQCENTLDNICEQYLPDTSATARAAKYSLRSGGKRVRAVLVLAVCDMLNGDCSAAAQLAGAVEMLHCYSLIHDDLPCMDNDDMRRGKPSCHKAFDEATALLAGDLLLTESFEVIANIDTTDIIRANATRALARGAGIGGMIYGQELDLFYETVQADEAQLRQIHQNKTGALINAAVQLGAVAGGADSKTSELLAQYASALGLVFQIVDDVLDETSTAEELGKPIGSDKENGKTTFVTLYGVDGAMALADKINTENCNQMQATFGEHAAFLTALAEQLLVRRS
ncbi:MAG: farnesyl diphosphate synthase [Faecalibacterium sp.]